MGEIKPPEPAMRIVVAISRFDEARTWARERVEKRWGPVALTSELFLFDQTDYYAPTMGEALGKQFWALEPLMDPEELADDKRATNQWEAEYAALGRHPQTRPLNLDPGYLGLGKFILASTKDHAHRIYLRDGIYAEVTLEYRHRAWGKLPWTFPDYQSVGYHEFLSRCRDYLKSRRVA